MNEPDAPPTAPRGTPTTAKTALITGITDALEFVDFDLADSGNIVRVLERIEPDAIVQPARALAKLVPAFQKESGARRLARVLSRDNGSRSFQVLLAGVQRLHEQVGGSAGPA